MNDICWLVQDFILRIMIIWWEYKGHSKCIRICHTYKLANPCSVRKDLPGRGLVARQADYWTPLQRVDQLDTDLASFKYHLYKLLTVVRLAPHMVA